MSAAAGNAENAGNAGNAGKAAAAEGTTYFIDNNSDILKKIIPSTDPADIEVCVGIPFNVLSSFLESIPIRDEMDTYSPRFCTLNFMYNMIKDVRFPIDPDTTDEQLLQELKGREELDRIFTELMEHYAPPRESAGVEERKGDDEKSPEVLRIFANMKSMFGFLELSVADQLMNRISIMFPQSTLERGAMKEIEAAAMKSPSLTMEAAASTPLTMEEAVASVKPLSVAERRNAEIPIGNLSGGQRGGAGIPQEVKNLGADLTQKARNLGVTTAPTTEAATRTLLHQLLPGVDPATLPSLNEIKKEMVQEQAIQRGGAGGGSWTTSGLAKFLVAAAALLSGAGANRFNSQRESAAQEIFRTTRTGDPLTNISLEQIRDEVNVARKLGLSVDEVRRRRAPGGAPGSAAPGTKPNSSNSTAVALTTPNIPNAVRYAAGAGGEISPITAIAAAGAVAANYRAKQLKVSALEEFGDKALAFVGAPARSIVVTPPPAIPSLHPDSIFLAQIKIVSKEIINLLNKYPEVNLYMKNKYITESLIGSTTGGLSPEVIAISATAGTRYSQEVAFDTVDLTGLTYQGEALLQRPTVTDPVLINKIFIDVVLGTTLPGTTKQKYEIIKTKTLSIEKSWASKIGNFWEEMMGSATTVEIGKASDIIRIQVWVIEHHSDGKATTVFPISINNINSILPLAAQFVNSPTGAFGIRTNSQTSSIFDYIVKSNLDFSVIGPLVVKDHPSKTPPAIITLINTMQELAQGILMEDFSNFLTVNYNNYDNIITAGERGLTVTDPSSKELVPVVTSTDVAIAKGGKAFIEGVMRVIVSSIKVPTVETVGNSIARVDASLSQLTEDKSALGQIKEMTSRAVGVVTNLANHTLAGMEAMTDSVGFGLQMLAHYTKGAGIMAPFLATSIGMSAISLKTLSFGSAIGYLTVGGGIFFSGAGLYPYMDAAGFGVLTWWMGGSAMALMATGFMAQLAKKTCDACRTAGAPPPEKPNASLMSWFSRPAASSGAAPPAAPNSASRVASNSASRPDNSGGRTHVGRGGRPVRNGALPPNATEGRSRSASTNSANSNNSFNSQATVPETPSSSLLSFPQITLERLQEESNSQGPLPGKSPFGRGASPFCANPSAGAAGTTGKGPSGLRGKTVSRRLGGGYRKSHKARHVTRRLRKLQRRRTTHHKRRVTK